MGFRLNAQRRPRWLRIWEMPDPDGIYSIGVDPAAGVGEDAGDASAAVVVDIRNLRQVAQLRCWTIDPFLFGREVARLGRFYGGRSRLAHLVVEANNHGQCTLERLKVEEGYWNLHAQRQMARNATSNGNSRWQNRIGFYMTAPAKDALVNDARRCFSAVTTDEYHQRFGCAIKDKDLLLEMESFKFLEEKNRFEAAEGKHDDLVIALCLAWWGRDTALHSVPAEELPQPDVRNAWLKANEDRMIRDLMAERGIDWYPEDPATEYRQVVVSWRPQAW